MALENNLRQNMKHCDEFSQFIKLFQERLKKLPDKRKGKNKQYEMRDAGLSAFGVFFTQSPSFLACQRTMEQKKGRSNAQTLFGAHKIPSDNQIRDLLDQVPPSYINPVFEESLDLIEKSGKLDISIILLNQQRCYNLKNQIGVNHD